MNDREERLKIQRARVARAWAMSKWGEHRSLFHRIKEPVKSAFWNMFANIFMNHAPSSVINYEQNINGLGSGGKTIFDIDPNFNGEFEYIEHLHDDPDSAEATVRSLVERLRDVSDSIDVLETKASKLKDLKLRGVARHKVYKQLYGLKIVDGKFTIVEIFPDVNGELHTLEDGNEITGTTPMRAVWRQLKKNDGWMGLFDSTFKVKKVPPLELSKEELDDMGVTDEVAKKSAVGRTKMLAAALGEAVLPNKRAIAVDRQKLHYVIKDGDRKIDVSYHTVTLSDAYDDVPIVEIVVSHPENDKEWGQQVGAKIHALRKVKKVTHEEYQGRYRKAPKLIETLYEVES